MIKKILLLVLIIGAIFFVKTSFGYTPTGDSCYDECLPKCELVEHPGLFEIGCYNTCENKCAEPIIIQKPETPEFTVTVSPRSQEIDQGEIVIYTVLVSWTRGKPETVNLQFSGTPDVTHIFDPPRGSGSFSSLLTVITTCNTPAAPVYSFQITASSETHPYSKFDVATLAVDSKPNCKEDEGKVIGDEQWSSGENGPLTLDDLADNNEDAINDFWEQKLDGGKLTADDTKNLKEIDKSLQSIIDNAKANGGDPNFIAELQNDQNHAAALLYGTGDNHEARQNIVEELKLSPANLYDLYNEINPAYQHGLTPPIAETPELKELLDAGKLKFKNIQDINAQISGLQEKLNEPGDPLAEMDSIERLRERVNTLDQKKLELEQFYEKILLDHPNDVEANFALGQLYFDDGYAGVADVLYKRATLSASAEDMNKMKAALASNQAREKIYNNWLASGNWKTSGADVEAGVAPDEIARLDNELRYSKLNERLSREIDSQVDTLPINQEQLGQKSQVRTSLIIGIALTDSSIAKRNIIENWKGNLEVLKELATFGHYSSTKKNEK